MHPECSPLHRPRRSVLKKCWSRIFSWSLLCQSHWWYYRPSHFPVCLWYRQDTPWLQPDWFCPSLHAQGARHFEFCLLCKLSCYYPPIQFILDLLKCLWVYSTKRFEVFQAFYSKYTSFLQVYRNMVYGSAIFLLNCSFYTNNIDNARYQAEIFCHYHTIISAFSL